MEDSQEARTWWKQWIWVEKLIFPVSVTQKEQLSGVFIFDFEKSAFLAHPIYLYLVLRTIEKKNDETPNQSEILLPTLMLYFLLRKKKFGAVAKVC